MIWVITSTDEQWFERKKEELVDQGVPEEYIIDININKEWGVTKEMIERHNR